MQIAQGKDIVYSALTKGEGNVAEYCNIAPHYLADVSANLISKATDVVVEQVIEWQSRPLDAVYPICLSGLHRSGNLPGQTGHQQRLFLALGINVECSNVYL